jgi:hypothetical protein
MNFSYVSPVVALREDASLQAAPLVARVSPGLSDGQILAHFIEALRAKPPNRQQIVHTY